MNAEIPEGWSNAKVEDLAELIRGITYKKEHARNSYEDGYKPILRANNINNTLNFDSLVYVPESLIDRKQYIEKDDIVFAMSSGSKHLVGKSARAIVDFNGSYGAFCGLVRPNINIYPPFLFYSFQDNRFKGFIQRVSKGSNINNLKREHILGYSIFYPPIDEQKNIVAKIEELFSELDSGIASLKTAREQLKIYRQSLLKHTFEGKLTEQWRKDNASKLETPEQLLARIQTERETRYQQQLEEWKQAVKDWEAKGKEGKKPSKPKKLKEIELSDYVFNENWLAVNFGGVANITGGLTKNQKRNTYEIQIPYLRVANVYANELRLEEVKTIGVTEQERAPILLEKYDLLIVEGNGSIEQIGRVALWNNAIHGCGHQNHLIRARLHTPSYAKLALYFLLSPVGRDFIIKEASSTSGLHTLSLTKVSNLLVPIMPIGEAIELIGQLEEKLSIIEQNEKEIEDALAKAELLRQSILKKAFSGQLL